MAEALKTPFGNSPADLNDPVPTSFDPNDIFGDLAEQAPPEVNVGAEGDSPDNLNAQMRQAQQNIQTQSQSDTVFDDLVPQPEVPVEEPPGTFSMEAQFPSADLIGARFAAAVPKTMDEKRQALENRLGKDNVKIKDNEFIIKLPGKKKFQQLDPDTFEVFNDLFTDTIREQLISAGGISAVAAQGPAAIEPVSSTAAFALGASAGAGLADTLAEQFLGVRRDTGRRGDVAGPDASVVEKVQAGLGRTVESLQEGAETAAFNAVAGQVSKKVADSIGKRLGRRNAIKSLKEISESEKTTQGVADLTDTMNELIALDKLKPLPGTDVPLLAHQVLPGNSKANKIADSLAGTEAFSNAQELAAKQLGDTVLDLVESAGRLNKGSLAKVVAQGVKADRSGLNVKVNDLLKGALQNEGKLIEQFRTKAKTIASKAALPVPKVTQSLTEVFEDLGVQRRGGELIFPDDDTMAQLLGTDSKAIINGLKNDLTRLSTMLATKGGMTIDELIGQSKLIGAKNKAAGRIGGIYKNIIGKLSSNVRADSREALPMILDEADGAAYNQAMDKFRSFAQSSDQLRNLLKEDMGANTFTRLLISKGKNGLGNLKAAKEFLLKEDPQLWQQVTGEFFEELALKHRNIGDKSKIDYNIKGMRKELAGYGKEFLDELLPGAEGVNTKTVLKAFDLAEQVKQVAKTGSDDQLRKVGKEAIQGTSNFISAKLNAVWALMSLGTQNGRLMKLISRDGIEEFTKEVPKKHRGKVRQALSSAIETAKRNGLLTQVQGTVSAGQAQDFEQLMGEVQRGLPAFPSPPNGNQ